MGERSEYYCMRRGTVWVGRAQSLVETKKEAVRKAVNMYVWFLVWCDASDVIDAEERIIGTMRERSFDQG